MYGCNFYCELAVVLSWVPLKRRRAELHIDTKNKTTGAEIANTEMIQILATYRWCYIWIGGKSVTPEIALWHSVHE